MSRVHVVVELVSDDPQEEALAFVEREELIVFDQEAEPFARAGEALNRLADECVALANTQLLAQREHQAEDSPGP